MFRIIVCLFLLVVFIFYIKYAVMGYKKNKAIKNSNLIRYDYHFMGVGVFLVVAAVYFVLILGMTLFANIEDITIRRTIMAFGVILMCMIGYVLWVMRKKIILGKDSFTYTTLFRTKVAKYNEIEVYMDNYGHDHFYKGNRKILKVSIYMENSLKLTRKLVQVNGCGCHRPTRRIK